MNIISIVVTLLQTLFSKNQTIAELLPVIEQVGAAFLSARAGQPFTVSFPEAIDGKAGTTTVGWTPTA